MSEAERTELDAILKEQRAAHAVSAGPPCPRCGCTMQGGAPHGPWPVQYECRCGYIHVPSGGTS